MPFATDSNRPQPLWQPSPTTCPTATGAASEVPSLQTHPCRTLPAPSSALPAPCASLALQVIALGEDELRSRGSMSWCGAQDVAARAYGEDWKTLGLCDRGYWDETNTRLFPNTCRLLRASRSAPAPCLSPPHHHQSDEGWV